MLDALPRSAFALLAGSAAARRLASRYGMRRSTSFARRFIAGETIAEAIDVARSIEQQGLLVTLDVLGGEVRLDSVYVPTIDPRYAMAATGDTSVHECVSAILSGSTIDARGRVYPVITLE